MTINHIDQLTEWWENAEESGQKVGDTVIYREDARTYTVFTAGYEEDDGDPNARILTRAPKPKPAWHDALAVIARYENSDTPQTFLRAGHLWVGRNGGKYTTDVLRDVTPLIEAKVTDAMIENAWSARDHNGQPYFTEWREASDFLTAALGIEHA